MSVIKAIIADDEEPLRDYLRNMLARLWPELEISGEAENGLQALELIDSLEPNVAFLDIRMPELSGIKVAEKIAGRCWIVFITAYDQYAIKAFENEAIDYILKPVTEKRLNKTIKRLKKQIRTTPSPPDDLSGIIENVLSTLEHRKDSYLNWIKGHQGDGIKIVPAKNIYYFKAEDKYTVVVTIDGELLIKKSIKQLSRELDPEKFWQIHRGTIVNANQIARVSRTFSGGLVVKLKELSDSLPVSRNYSYLFKQM